MKQLRIIGLVLLSPGRGLSLLLARPKSALVVLLLILCAIASHLMIHSRIDVEAQKRITAEELSLEQPGQEVSDEEVDKKTTQALNLRRIGGYALYLVGIPFAIFAMSILLWLGLGAWGEGRGFKRCFRLVAHTWLPLAIRQLAALPVIATYPTINPEQTQGLFKTSAESLMGPGAFPGSFLVDPFAAWAGLLVFVAGRTLGRGRIWSGIVALVFWVMFAVAIKSF